MSESISTRVNMAAKILMMNYEYIQDSSDKAAAATEQTQSSNVGWQRNEFLTVSITKTTGRMVQNDSDPSITEKIVEEISGMELSFRSIREIKESESIPSELPLLLLPGSLNENGSSSVYKSTENFHQVEYQTIGQVENKEGEKVSFETGIKLTGYQSTTSLKQYSESNPLIIRADEFKKEDAKDVAFLFDIKDENAVFPESGVGYIKWIDDLKESLGVAGSSANPEEVLSFGNYYENLFTSKFNYLEVSEDGSFTSYDVNFTYFSSHEQNSYSADSQRWIS